MATNLKTALGRPFLPCLAAEIDDFLSQPTAEVREVLARTPETILVLGAGGKIGLHLSVMIRRALDSLRRTDRVVAVSRFRMLRQREDFERRGVITHPCDLADPHSLAKLPDAPTIFFLAGAKFGTADSPDLLRKMNVEMPKSVVERFPEARFVVFSTGCVYPFVSPESGGATEDTPPAPVGDYAVSCLERERVFAAASQRRGNPMALIRLNYSNEFRYGVLVDIAQRVLQGKPIDVTMGHVNVIWQTDAISHVIRALDIARSPAVPINITGPDTLAVRSLACRFGKLLGGTVRTTGTEAETVWLSSAAWAHRLFGPPATSPETMMAWIAAWLSEGGKTWGKSTGFERRDGRF